MSVDDYIPDWAKETGAPDFAAEPPSTSWKEALLAAVVAGVVVGTAVLLSSSPPVAPAAPADDEDEDDELVTDAAELEAAARLGVDVNASDDVVRAALRERLAASRIHPDHGGNHGPAAELIAAKNLLCARARRRERTDAETTT